DDFSTDGTRDILAKLHIPDVKVILQPKNMGKGAAIRSGLEKATGEVVVPQDSDLELDPYIIVDLLNYYKKNQAQAVYGSRFRDAKFSFNPYFLANYILSLFTSLLFFRRVTDMETCYKMVNRELLLSLNLKANRFDIEPEVTAKLLKKKIHIKEYPIHLHYKPRSTKEGKKINLGDAFMAVWTLIKVRLTNK
ncbi:MAG: glycosyltransferase family 2 protein, partial [Candidatus Margulisbacteria bacterium]|nr:glycosyltransferase family 2 protein [Candidatus Margulisiibacteriota bacterium]